MVAENYSADLGYEGTICGEAEPQAFWPPPRLTLPKDLSSICRYLARPCRLEAITEIVLYVQDRFPLSQVTVFKGISNVDDVHEGGRTEA